VDRHKCSCQAESADDVIFISVFFALKVIKDNNFGEIGLLMLWTERETRRDARDSNDEDE